MMDEAIKSRISRRSFSKNHVKEEDIRQIRNWIEGLNAESSLNMELLEDGSEAFEGFRKSYGMFTNVRSMLLMKGSGNDENLKVKIGYYGEELVLRLTRMGLGTCWVGGTYDSSLITIPQGEKLICVIVLGYPESTIKDSLVRTLIRSKNRKTIPERTVADTTLPPAIRNGMEAVQLAPSAVNRQNPTLYFKEGIVTMGVDQKASFDLVDLGIAMKHFEIGAGSGRFDLVNNGRWHI